MLEQKEKARPNASFADPTGSTGATATFTVSLWTELTQPLDLPHQRQPPQEGPVSSVQLRQTLTGLTADAVR